MRKYIDNYVKEIDKKIEKKNVTKADIDTHLIKISFFQHERLIHLLVTLFYALYLFISVIIFLKIWQFSIIVFLEIIILLFYVRHYFFLENNIQYLYKQYDNMKKQLYKKEKSVNIDK